MAVPHFEIASALMRARVLEAIETYGFERVIMLATHQGAGRNLVKTRLLKSNALSVDTPKPLPNAGASRQGQDKKKRGRKEGKGKRAAAACSTKVSTQGSQLHNMLELPPPLLGGETSLPGWFETQGEFIKAGAIFVVRKRQCRPNEIKALRELCEAHNLPLIGCIWNDYSPKPLAGMWALLRRVRSAK